MTKKTTHEKPNPQKNTNTDDTVNLDFDDGDSVSFSSPIKRRQTQAKNSISNMGISKSELNTLSQKKEPVGQTPVKTANEAKEASKSKTKTPPTNESIDTTPKERSKPSHIAIANMSLKQCTQLYFVLEGLASGVTSKNDEIYSSAELKNKTDDLLRNALLTETISEHEVSMQKKLDEIKGLGDTPLADKIVYDWISQSVALGIKNKELGEQYALTFIQMCRDMNSLAIAMAQIDSSKLSDRKDEDAEEESIETIIKEDNDSVKEVTSQAEHSVQKTTATQKSATKTPEIDAVIRQDAPSKATEKSTPIPGNPWGVIGNTIPFEFKPTERVFSTGYQARLLQNLQGESKIKSMVNVEGKGVLLKFDLASHNEYHKSADIMDTGNSLCKMKTKNSEPTESAREMINVVKAKGWSKITIQSNGDKKFEDKLHALAKKANISVRVIGLEPIKPSTDKSDKPIKKKNSILKSFTSVLTRKKQENTEPEDQDVKQASFKR
jgi:hypothetical protein